jgi:hypothetical protein
VKPCNIHPVRVLAPLGLVLAPMFFAPLTAQQPAAAGQAAAATVIGAVFDSIRMRPMAGASVRLDTTDRVVLTDSDGRFRMEGVPDGTHELRIDHPILDTIGIALRTPKQQFDAGSVVVAQLATPSPETLVQLLCSSAWRARGPAALVGRVREADQGTPATGAKVSLVWYELEVANGIKRTPRLREVTVGPDGTYKLCGLPAQLDGKVQVLRGPLTSGEITISFGDHVLFLRSMSIAAPGAVVATMTDSGSAKPVIIGSARLTGRVMNLAGRPLPNARVQLDGTTRVAATRENGEFTLDSLPAGTQTVSVRLLGYGPAEQAVDLSSREPTNVTIRLTDFVPVLEAVRVTAARERALDGVGFNRRKRSSSGHFMDGDAINTSSLNFSDVMRTAPGIRTVPVNGRQMLVSSRDMNGCVNVFIDGTQWQQMEPGDIDDFVKPHELAAIEVYSSSNTPAEFQARNGSCTTIVAWTVRRLDRKR